MNTKKKPRKEITISSPRTIGVKPGDVFGSVVDLVVVAIDGAAIDWAKPPATMPKGEYVAVRNSRTGRLSVMMTRKLQVEHGRASERTTYAALLQLAYVLDLKVKKVKDA